MSSKGPETVDINIQEKYMLVITIFWVLFSIVRGSHSIVDIHGHLVVTVVVRCSSMYNYSFNWQCSPLIGGL